jgi:ubiquitin-conjugating enzyme (huntingtin interacting protein 2)
MAALNSLVRIKKEYAEVSKGPDGSGVSAVLVNENWEHWKGSITGPEGGPYEGGLFDVDIQIPKNYPFVPPKMRFITRVWHPNISSANGAICLDILKNEWSPALTLRTALLSLQALLSCPNPDDPQDAQVAGMYKKDFRAFENTARMWTQMYATQGGVVDIKAAKLAEMGFDMEKCVAALTRSGGDEEQALNFLLAA